MEKKVVKIISIEPYSQELIVVLNGQFSDAVKVYKRQKSANAKESVKYIEENKDKYLDDKTHNVSSLYTELPHGYVMLIDHYDRWIETVGHIVHESLHLTHYVLMRAGLTLCKESEEAYTYLTEQTVEKILEIAYPPKPPIKLDDKRLKKNRKSTILSK